MFSFCFYWHLHGNYFEYSLFCLFPFRIIFLLSLSHVASPGWWSNRYIPWLPPPTPEINFPVSPHSRLPAVNWYTRGFSRHPKRSHQSADRFVFLHSNRVNFLGDELTRDSFCPFIYRLPNCTRTDL